ncbi:hypothetical protein PF007_g13466 [Phytophthora fragariae]|nr:hypothetical protein PF009_g18936 [Phytophthora fragariae]KAE9106271.1 hypothetical protein PF007_g13466 [Phytophthora fragariae]
MICDRWQDAEVAQRLALRLEVLKRENQELRRRVPQWGQDGDTGEWQRRWE